MSVCIERRAVSEPSSPAHPLLHLSFSLSDISPFSSNHFLPFGPLFFLMQLSLIPPFLPLSLYIPLFLLLCSSHWYFSVLLCKIFCFFFPFFVISPVMFWLTTLCLPLSVVLIVPPCLLLPGSLLCFDL